MATYTHSIPQDAYQGARGERCNHTRYSDGREVRRIGLQKHAESHHVHGQRQEGREPYRVHDADGQRHGQDLPQSDVVRQDEHGQHQRHSRLRQPAADNQLAPRHSVGQDAAQGAEAHQPQTSHPRGRADPKRRVGHRQREPTVRHHEHDPANGAVGAACPEQPELRVTQY